MVAFTSQDINDIRDGLQASAHEMRTIADTHYKDRAPLFKGLYDTAARFEKLIAEKINKM